MINESTTDSEYLTEVNEAMKLLKKNTERRTRAIRRSEKLKRYYENNPGLRMKVSHDMKVWWANPENREKMLQIRKSPEFRKAVSEGLKRRKYRHSTKVKQKISQTTKSNHRMHSWTAEELNKWGRTMRQKQQRLKKQKQRKLKTLHEDNR